MPKIVIIQPLRPTAYQVFDDHPDIEWEVIEDTSPESLHKCLADADGATIRTAPIPASAIDEAQRLKVISRHGVGYDNVPIDVCTRQKVVVAITADANAVSVAEHTMFLVLAAARRAIENDRTVRESRFSERLDLIGMELYGKTLLIVGMGRIGHQLAGRAQAFGMKILAFDPYLSGHFPDAVEFVDCLEDGLVRANILSLHVPLTDSTRNLIGNRELNMLPQGAIIINAGRGGLVDETALLQNIRSGHLFGAGLDTFVTEPPAADSPLLTEPRIFLSPHSAALTAESLDAMGRQSIRNAIDAIKGTLDPRMVVNPSALSAAPISAR
ncbi:MAG: hydroxyacid dehydrogenase [Rhodobacteraceae bacterium]|nr:hydroxyacid dehydrogenase [Paracoccaceae bacterium]